MNILFTKFRGLTIFISILLIPCITFAGMNFDDVPKNHWAYDAISELSERGIIEGFEGVNTKKFQGEKPLTRYEFAQALYKAIVKLETELSIKKSNSNEIDVNEVLSKSNLDKKDVELLKKLIEEFKKELTDMNLRVSDLETKQRRAEIKKTDKTPLYLSIGSAIISVIALIVSISK